MRFILVIALFGMIVLSGVAQQLSAVDSLISLSSKQAPSEQLKSYQQIAEQLLYTDPEKSFEYAKKSLHLAINTNDYSGQVLAYNSMGWYFMNNFEHDSAKYYLLKSFQLGIKKADAKGPVLNAMSGLANVLTEQLKHDSAIIILNQAIDIANSIKSAPHLANLYAVLGNTYSMYEQMDTAIALYYTAKNFYKEAGNQKDLAVMLNNIASLMIQDHKYERALELLSEAIDINQEINNVNALILNRNHEAICYREMGLPENAINSLKQNIELATNNNLTTSLAINYTTMGNTLIKMERYTQARLYFDSSLVICKEKGIDYGILINNIALGQMYQSFGHCDSSIAYFKTAAKLCNPLSMNDKKSNIFEGLYLCYKQYGQYDSALYYFEQYKVLSDSVHLLDVNNKLVELEGKYEQEKNLAKIASLNENVYKEKSKYQIITIIFTTTFFIILIITLIRRNKIRNKFLRAKIVEKEKLLLESKLTVNQKELAVKAMHVARLNELSFDVSQKLKEIAQDVSNVNSKKIRNLINSLEITAPANAWKEFELRFENVHQEFYNVLLEQYPDLTPTEIKVCSLIRLNMTSKDIAIITNRSIRTIESARSSIRKKCKLTPEQSLNKYLLSI